MILSIQVVALLALSTCAPAGVDQCPHAILTCHQSLSNKVEYACAITASYPSKRNAPQYTWAVSEGRIVGDPKSPNVTLDLSGVQSESVTVKAEVHWRRLPRVCDASVVEKISLR